MERSTKRQKVADWGSAQESYDHGGGTLKSLSRSITPPPTSHSRLQSPPAALHESETRTLKANQDTKLSNEYNATPQKKRPTTVASPIKLTHIRDLPSSSGNNVDTVRLHDILGDPMIRECWQFNYLFDVDFVMSQFDEDIRQMVQVKFVHGSWKKEAPNRVRIDVSTTNMKIRCLA
jgi:tyrosyl-DNA phosphodiesterase-1